MAKAGYTGEQPVRVAREESYPGAWTGQEQNVERKANTWSLSPVYEIERSLRFNSSDSAYLSKSITNITTFTLSYWMKRCGSGRDDTFVTESSTGFFYYVHTDGSIRVNDNTANRFVSNGLYRDPSAWYHVVINNNGSTFNLYVNGVLDKSASVSLALYSGTALIGRDRVSGASNHANFYLADVFFIDGQALTPTSFGKFDDNGVWQPKAYTGTYPGNSFHLDFSDNSSNAALGTDTSGNNHTWTVNNISVAAGAGNDSLVDTPTSYGTDTGAGGEARGNYCTWNALDKTSASTLTNGNLDYTTSVSGADLIRGTFGLLSGKWYWEVMLTTSTAAPVIGIAKSSASQATLAYLGSDANGWGYISTGSKVNNSSITSYGSSYTVNDIVGVAFDADNGTLVFYKNGVIQNSGVAAYTGLTSGPYFPAFSDTNSAAASFCTVNFGQRPFAYTAPSGFKALCTTNLPEPVVAKPSTVMDVKLYTGNGSTQTISGLGMSPDLVWIKERSSTSSHQLYDTIRGATNTLYSNSTNEEQVNANALTSFTSTGFNVGVDNNVNQSAQTYVAWAWDAGSSTVTNTQGSITSQVRANASAGFSIQTWTASGSSSIGHGLGVAPEFIIVKRRNVGQDWYVWHKALTFSQYLFLNSDSAVQSFTNIWGAGGPSSSVFTFSASPGDHVSYCFAPVANYSAFGSYTGNGSSDGPFIYTGFRPRWVMIKGVTGGDHWYLYDSARLGYNPRNEQLTVNLSDAEYDAVSYPNIDICANGFKTRTTNTGRNANGTVYIYACFAESPLQYARAR
jgi:hypothetical protein